MTQKDPKKVNGSQRGHTSESRRKAPSPAKRGDAGNGNGNGARGAAESDRRLVDRCLAGDGQAWEQLFRSQQPDLLAATRRLLRSGGGNADLVEEIAARVWLTLLRDRCRVLDRYDPARDRRLEVFLAGIARFEIKRYMRSEDHRRSHESAAGRELLKADRVAALEIGSLLNEFAATLRPSELEFVEEYLLGSHDNGAGDSPKLSAAAVWQRRHRLRRKLRSFLDG